MKSTINRLLALMLISLVAFFMPGCGGDDDNDHEVVLQSIAVSPASPTLPIGTEQIFAAKGFYSDGSVADITDKVDWTSSDTTVLEMRNHVGAAIAAGNATVTATLGSVKGIAKVIVPKATLEKIQLSFANGETSVIVPKGTTGSLVATAIYSDGTTANVTSYAQYVYVPEVVDVQNDGDAVAIGVGNSDIIAKFGGVNSNAAKVTVTDATLQSITISPADVTMPIHATQAFIVEGTYSDGTIHEITKDCSFNSSDLNVIKIDNNIATAVAAGNAEITATAGPGVTATAKVTVPKATVESIQLTFANGETSVSVPKGTTGSLVATAIYSDGTTADVTRDAQYVYDPKVIDVQNDGDAVAIGIGNSDIVAKFDGKSSNTAKVTVTDATLQSITISPADVTMPIHATQAFMVEGTYSDGTIHDITKDCSFTSSDIGVVTVVGNEATAVADGNADITATAGPGITATAKVTVPKATLEKIQLTFANGETSIIVPKGTTGSLVATAIYSDGTTADVTTLAKYVYNGEIIDVRPNGNAVAVGVGSSDITAKFEGKSSNVVKIKVTAATLQSITLSPSGYTMPVGDQVQFSATGTFSDGTRKDITESVNWTSSDPAVASVDNVKFKGLVTANAEGTANITAMLDGVRESRAVRVNAPTVETLLIEPSGSASVPAGTGGSFKAIAGYSDGTSYDVTSRVHWISSDTNVVAFDGSAGYAKAIHPGTATITAKLENVTSSNSATITVTDAQLESIVIQPDNVSMFTGSQQKFEAIGKYSNGDIKNITNDVAWVSQDISLVTIAQNGIATANKEKAGTTNIEASLNGVTASASVEVKNPTLTSIKVVTADDTGRTEFVVGTSLQLKALGTFDDGTTDKDITNDVTWLTESDTVSVSTSGLVRALKAGDATVTASYKGVSGSINGTVVEKTIKKIEIFTDPSNGQTTIDKPIYLTAYAIYNDDSTKDITLDATWRSRDDAVDNVVIRKEKGVVYAKAAEGEANARITAEFDGVEGEKYITFLAPAFDHLEIQEGYCPNGDCPVITGKTIDVGIVDDVDKQDPEAYYFTLWAVYKDGRKEYVNTEINVWTADMVRVYVNGTIGTFVFGRGTTDSPVEVRASWGDKATASFFVNVKENPQKTLVAIKIKNAKDDGWGCSDMTDDYTSTLTLKPGDEGKYLMACGKYHDEQNDKDEWIDINNNVAWSSSNPDVARVKTITGDTLALDVGTAKISAKLADKTGSIEVEVEAEE